MGRVRWCRRCAKAHPMVGFMGSNPSLQAAREGLMGGLQTSAAVMDTARVASNPPLPSPTGLSGGGVLYICACPRQSGAGAYPTGQAVCRRQRRSWILRVSPVTPPLPSPSGGVFCGGEPKPVFCRLALFTGCSPPPALLPASACGRRARSPRCCCGSCGFRCRAGCS